MKRNIFGSYSYSMMNIIFYAGIKFWL